MAAYAARTAFDECAIYFTETRDSLRNVRLDILAHREQAALMNSESFWRRFILKVSKSPKSEPELWDLKETLTLWHAPKGPERDKARLTFAEDVAALANARGGVLVVGVTDEPRKIVGVADRRDLEGRLQAARQTVDAFIEYDRDLVTLKQVIVPDSAGVDRVCLVIVVAGACSPVAVGDGQGRFTYPVRRQAGIERVSFLDLIKHVKADNHDFLPELERFVREG